MGTTMTISVDRQARKNIVNLEVGGKEEETLQEALMYAACLPENLPFTVEGDLEALVEGADANPGPTQSIRVLYENKEIFYAQLPILKASIQTRRGYDIFINELGGVLLKAIIKMEAYVNEKTEGSVMRFKVN